MNIKEALTFGAKKLKKINNASLDAAILLCVALGKPKEFIYTHPEKKLTTPQTTKYKKFISRRAKHEPVAYILGKKEFYGFEFAVTPSVLIPRPDTETLIAAVLSTIGFPTSNLDLSKFTTIGSRKPDSLIKIIDVGTGSGAIAVTLKKLLPKANVFASDISPAALALAKKNARRLNAKIIFKKGNLLKPFVIPAKAGIQNWIPRQKSLPRTGYGVRDDAPLIITANLPYLSRAEWQKTAPEVKKYEPYGALVGGKTGTEIYEKLFEEINQFCHSRRHSDSGGNIRESKNIKNLDSRFRGNDTSLYLFIEIGWNQKRAIEKIAKKILNPKKIEFFKDLAGKWRVANIDM
ncbi:MAG: peptide chain release factor N(5)-glutamine methyltransferase [bacterium]